MCMYIIAYTFMYNTSKKIMQVVIGDQLSCKNIRGSKLWRQTEVKPIDTLKWAHETPGIGDNMHVKN